MQGGMLAGSPLCTFVAEIGTVDSTAHTLFWTCTKCLMSLVHHHGDDVKADHLQALASALCSLAPGLVLNSELRRTCCKLLNGMHHTFLHKVLAEDGRQLVHEDLCQLQGLGHNGVVFLRQQASNEAGDGQICQLLAQGCGLTEVQDLGDGGQALSPHLQAAP